MKKNLNSEEFFEAAEKGDVKKIISVLKAGIDPNLTNSRWTALHFASQEGHLEVIKLLLENGANINAQVKWGDEEDEKYETALQLASMKGHLEVVKLLLENGANPNIQGENDDQYVHSALHSASEEGHLKVVKLLLENGANINMKEPLGWTALHYAYNNLEMVKLLIKNGADVNIEDEDGRTPLHSASQEGHLEVIKLLLENGADINAQVKQSDWDGKYEYKTALQLANQKGHSEAVKFLLSKGATITRKEKIRLIWNVEKMKILFVFLCISGIFIWKWLTSS